MKKLLQFLGLFSLTFIFFGCSSEFDQRANNYASHAMEALVDYVETYISVESVEWICFDAEDLEGEKLNSCVFYIEYSQEKSSFVRYAEIFIFEFSSEVGIGNNIFTYNTRKLLDDEYKDNLNFANETKKDFSDEFNSFDYDHGTLSKREITRALNSIK